MSQELASALNDAKPVFRRRWSELVTQRQYDFEVADFSPQVRRRHMALWENLIKGLHTERYEPYLALVEAEGRLQARALSRVESVVSQLTEIMNLVWDVLSTMPAFETDPRLLRPLTEKLNLLRSRAESALLTGFVDENRLIQEELAKESQLSRRYRLEQTSLAELIKSVQSFRLVRYDTGQLIFQPGDRGAGVLFFVMNGQVRLYELLPDGRSISLSILSTNDVFTQSNNRNSYFHDVYAEAMSPTIVARIDEKALENLMIEAPLLAERIIHSFSQQLSQSQTLIQGLLGRDIAARMVKLLLKLAEEFGVSQSDGGVSIGLSLTHQELADMIGSNRVTVTRKLLELQKKHLIKVENHTISIVNLQTLEELAS